MEDNPLHVGIAPSMLDQIVAGGQNTCLVHSNAALSFRLRLGLFPCSGAESGILESPCIAKYGKPDARLLRTSLVIR